MKLMQIPVCCLEVISHIGNKNDHHKSFNHRRTKMKWHFPLINPSLQFSLKHYFDHIKEELKEYEAEPAGSIEQAKEVVDVLHSAETLVRKFFERNPQHSFDDIKARTVEKNRARGYYDE